MKKPLIAVLFGGCSTEYHVSLQSAAAVLTHWDYTRFAALPVGITREGAWLHYTGPIGRIADDTWQEAGLCHPCLISPDRTHRELIAFTPAAVHCTLDGMFPVLHGKNGEDGTVQGLAELAGIPLIGCGTLASALCMDKDRAHRLAAQAGIRVPRSAVFCREEGFAGVASAAETIGYPLFVKPVRSGSSLGVSRVEGPEELCRAVTKAASHDREILLEEAIDGFEVGCAVLGGIQPTVGAVDEIALDQGFFDYREKYTLETASIHCPARISPKIAGVVQRTAIQLYRLMGCRGFARVDMFVTVRGEVVFHEINTIPGFTAHSRYPAMMQKAGISFDVLLTRAIEEGLAS